MRRFVFLSIGSLCLMGLLVGVAPAQAFRRTFPTAPVRPAFANNVRGNFVPATSTVAFNRFPVGATGVSAAFNPFSPLRVSPQAAIALASYYNTTPANALIASGYNPYSVQNPYFRHQHWAHTYWNPYLYGNPYSYGNYYGYANPYANSNPYTNPYSSGYGYNPYAASYQSTGANYGTQSYASAPAYAPNGAQAKQPSVLGVAGVAGENSAMDWPLALRLMPTEQRKTLLDPLETQLQMLAKQAAADRANPALVRQARQSVENVYRWLQDRRVNMADGSYRDAEGFLSRLDRNLQTMGTGS
jgi:hypothetical protein